MGMEIFDRFSTTFKRYTLTDPTAIGILGSPHVIEFGIPGDATAQCPLASEVLLTLWSAGVPNAYVHIRRNEAHILAPAAQMDYFLRTFLPGTPVLDVGLGNDNRFPAKAYTELHAAFTDISGKDGGKTF